ncbi:hypothetical protein BJX66DRAFT_345845 [Aspergillus keveii]|uniref:F-box domain-containing protein n=1 Tax=Aspergillus keveii TaxID=714993 RepID=A0ABR4FGP2_9EURO
MATADLIPTEILLSILDNLQQRELSPVSLVCRRFRALTVRRIFRHLRFTLCARRMRHLQELAMSPLATQLYQITYQIPAHHRCDASDSIDQDSSQQSKQSSASSSKVGVQQEAHRAVYKTLSHCTNLGKVRIECQPVEHSLHPAQSAWLSYSWQALLGALAQQPRNARRIRSVMLDVFHTHDTVESLGLRECFGDAFTTVTMVHLRGQYRFWDSVMTLGCFPSVTHLTVDDCTIQLATLQRFLTDRRAVLTYVCLKQVALFPYPQLGFISRSGTYAEVTGWLRGLPDRTPL